nr:DUF805 domain-containing protein [Sphingomonas sp.]
MQNLSPIGWAVRPIKRYAEFSGRSSRAEFWWFILALFVIYMVMWMVFVGAMAGSIATAQGNPSSGMLGAIGVGGIVVGLFWLALIIPTIAVQVRRLHDTDRSGWWLGGYYLLYVVYFVLMFTMIVPIMSQTVVEADTAPALPSSGMFVGIILFGTVMFIYMIALLVFFCLPGTRGANRFGDDPYGADVEEVFA